MGEDGEDPERPEDDAVTDDERAAEENDALGAGEEALAERGGLRLRRGRARRSRWIEPTIAASARAISVRMLATHVRVVEEDSGEQAASERRSTQG